MSGYVSEEQPFGRPAGVQQIVITLNLGGPVRTPADVRHAVAHAMWEYTGTTRDNVPFDQQPGFLQSRITDHDGTYLGTWEVRES